MTTPRIVRQAQREAPSYNPFVNGDAVAVPDKPLPVLRGTRDAIAVLHQIRALLLFACFLLATIALAAVAIGSHLRDPRPGTVAEFPTPSPVTLSLQGDPALDYFAHVELADGSQRDVQLGAYLMDGPVRIVLHSNSADLSTTTCRISIAGVLVATETAQDGATATCEWRAS
jgi:hypothetical protein